MQLKNIRKNHLRRFIIGAAMQAILFPISVLPVNDIIFASGWRTKASPAVAPLENRKNAFKRTLT